MHQRRPTTVTVLALTFLLGGAFLGLIGLVAITSAGPVIVVFGAHTLWSLFTGSLAVLVGWGLWNLWPSAWRAGVVLCLAAIILETISFGNHALVAIAGGMGAYVLLAIPGFLLFVFGPLLLILLLLSRPGVRAALTWPTEGGMLGAIKLGLTKARRLNGPRLPREPAPMV